MKTPNVLFRRSSDTDLEFETCSKYFQCFNLRSQVPSDSLVIARYSALPFYKELEEDLAENNSTLINTFNQHNYIADLGNWVYDLGELTPQTWRRLIDVPDDGGPFIVKGATNSKKFCWNTHMFANNKREAIDVACKLMDDGLICDQHIYVRQYVPLVKMLDGLQGMPVSEEYRFFICDNKILSGGYYWSNYSEDIFNGCPNSNVVPVEFLNKVIQKIDGRARFFALDVARTQSGNWIVIELNDGQMSGLSENDPDVLYGNLKIVLTKNQL